MIARILGSGAGIAGMVDYATHDQTSAADPKPTTSARVAWAAGVGAPTDDPARTTRIMQGITADAPTLKHLAGISARGRKLKNPYLHLMLSEPAGAPTPSREQMLTAVDGAMAALGLAGHYAVAAAHTDTDCPHVHVAIGRVSPMDGRAPACGKPALRSLQRWAEQYEREHGGIVVPKRIAVRETIERRTETTRTCRKAGMDRSGARTTAAKLHPWPKSGRRASPKPPAPSAPADNAEWRSLTDRQAAEARQRRATQAAAIERRRAEWRRYTATAGQAPGTTRTPRPASPSLRRIRSAGAEAQQQMQARHRAERVSLARRLGRRAVRAVVRGAAAVRDWLSRSRRREPGPDRGAERERLAAQLRERVEAARKRRIDAVRDRLWEARDRATGRHMDVKRQHRQASGLERAELDTTLRQARDAKSRADERIDNFYAAITPKRGQHPALSLTTAWALGAPAAPASSGPPRPAPRKPPAAPPPDSAAVLRRRVRQPQRPAPERRPEPTPPQGPTPPSRASGTAEAQERAGRDRDRGGYGH